MSVTQDHIVKKQTLHLVISSTENSWAIQNHMSELSNDVLANVLAKVCDEFDVDQRHIRIPKIELDLGVISKQNLDKDFIEKAEIRFREVLNEFIQSSESDSINLLNHQSETEVIIYFLKYGVLPWWVTESENDLNKIFAKLIGKKDVHLINQLTPILKNKLCRHRLIAQFENELVENMVSLLSPESDKFLKKHKENLLKILMIQGVISNAFPATINHLVEAILEQIVRKRSDAITEERDWISNILIYLFKNFPSSGANDLIDLWIEISETQKASYIKSKKDQKKINEIVKLSGVHISQSQLKAILIIAQSLGSDSLNEIYEYFHSAKSRKDASIPNSKEEREHVYKKENSIASDDLDNQKPNDKLQTIKKLKEAEEQLESSSTDLINSNSKNRTDAQEDADVSQSRKTNKDFLKTESASNSNKDEEAKEKILTDSSPNPLSNASSSIGSEANTNEDQEAEDEFPANSQSKTSDKNSTSIENASEASSKGEKKRSTHSPSLRKIEESKKEEDNSNRSKTSKQFGPKSISIENTEEESRNRNLNESPKSDSSNMDDEPIEVTSEHLKTENKEAIENEPTTSAKPAETPSIKKKGVTDSEIKNTEKEWSKHSKNDWFDHESEQASFDDLDEIYIKNSGLVILWTYLSRFFNLLKLTKNGEFVDEEARERSLFILQHFIGNLEPPPEHELFLNKLLVGWPLAEPIRKSFIIDKQTSGYSKELLQATISNWSILKNTSTEAFQLAFLQRDGVLKKRGMDWQLKVDQKPFDVVFEHLPWPISIIKLPWMKNVIYVEW